MLLSKIVIICYMLCVYFVLCEAAAAPIFDEPDGTPRGSGSQAAA